MMHVVLVAGLSLGAAPPAKPSGRIAALIEHLGDDSFDRRQAASRALEAIGKPAVRALQKAAAANADPEVRFRAERVIAAIATRFPAWCKRPRRNTARRPRRYFPTCGR